MLRKFTKSCIAQKSAFKYTQQMRSFGAEDGNYGSKLDKYGEPRFLEQVKLFMNRAGQKTDIPKDMFEFIESCASVIRFNIPLKMDDGRIKTVACYRAQHSTHALPTKGGTRYADDITL